MGFCSPTNFKVHNKKSTLLQSKLNTLGAIRTSEHHLYGRGGNWVHIYILKRLKPNENISNWSGDFSEYKADWKGLKRCSCSQGAGGLGLGRGK